jgi:hypothetical protein
VNFQIPPLISEDLCQKARNNLIARGKGRGKQGKSIKALFRNRMFCPKCGSPMIVRRNGRQHGIYYYCSRYFRPWAENPCNYRKFIPGAWDDLVWEDICALLKDDVWVEQQLLSEQSQDENIAKLIRLHQFKVSQAQAKIGKVQEGFEGGIYTLEEAKKRIADNQSAIAKAESEIQRLQESIRTSTSSKVDIEAMREELTALRDKNLDKATFDEKFDIVSKLGIKVYPSEDLESMRVVCQLNLKQVQSDNKRGRTEPNEKQACGKCEPKIECGKVHIGPPEWI